MHTHTHHLVSGVCVWERECGFLRWFPSSHWRPCVWVATCYLRLITSNWKPSPLSSIVDAVVLNTWTQSLDDGKVSLNTLWFTVSEWDETASESRLHPAIWPNKSSLILRNQHIQFILPLAAGWAQWRAHLWSSCFAQRGQPGEQFQLNVLHLFVSGFVRQRENGRHH